MSDPYNNSSSVSSDDRYLRQAAEAKCANTNLQRYSRTKLYALRSNARSQRKPDCASRFELQTLGFWKFSIQGGHENITGSLLGSGNGTNEVVNNVGTGSTTLSTRGARERPLNLRERQMSYPRNMRSSPGDTVYTHTNATAQKAALIDQRSNSIAHLMPAFAKKRIAATTAQSPNHDDNHEFTENRDIVSQDSTSRPQRGKETVYEQQQRRSVNDHVEYSSPHRRIDNERDSSGSTLNGRHNLQERRIGSGRLLPRDVNWEYHEKNSGAAQQRQSARFTERGNTSSSYQEKGSFERRGGGHDSFISNTQSGNRRYNSNDHVRLQRHSLNDGHDEPEWFSGGPTSQNDIIELRGFDEPIEDNEHVQNNEKPSNIQYADSSQSSISFEPTSMNSIELAFNKSPSEKTIEAESVGISSNGANKVSLDQPDIDDDNKGTEIKADMSKEFNFDAFFNLDSLDSEIMHPNTAEPQKESTSGVSRFSQWFVTSKKADEIVNAQGSVSEKSSSKAANVLEFFQNAKIGSTGQQKHEIPSVEELEAKMRKIDVQEKDAATANIEGRYALNPDNTQKNNNALQDTDAFKKLLDQLNNGMRGQENVSAPESIPPQQQHLGAFPHINMHPAEVPQMMPPMLAIQPGATMNSNTSPSQQIDINSTINPHFVNVPLIEHHKRREFVYLLHAVTRGQIPLAALEKELSNPNTSILTREIIIAVLREATRSLTPSLGINIINNSSQAKLAPVNLLRGSPVHQQGLHSPIPLTVLPTSQMLGSSNQILVQASNSTEQIPQAGPPIGLSNLQDVHMRSQVIMQNVMMKKKMDEHQQQQQQQDSIRRQNEFESQQTGQQPPRHLNSPTPLAFTPTSVLRKMTAEKDNNHQQQSQQQQQQKLLTQMPNKTLNHGVFINQNQQQLPPAIPQPRMILGGNHTSNQQVTNNQQPAHAQHLNQPISPQPLHTQQRVPPNEAKWSMNLIGPVPLNKPLGRPILKGPPPPMTLPISQHAQQQPHMQIMGHLQSTSQQNSQGPSMMFTAKLDMQQQQRLKHNQTPQHVLNAQPQTQGFQTVQHLQQPLPQVPQTVLHMQQQLQHTQQQQLFQMHHMSLQQQQHMQLQRQLHQQMHTQPNAHSQQQQLQQHESTNRGVNFSQSQTNHTNSTSGNSAAATIVCQREGGLSPTSNQLAQWFSPELLAQASAGKLPQINMNQALSLEEFEKSIQQHSSAVVHN